MKNPDKSKEELIQELLELRRQVAKLQADALPRDCMTLIDRNYVYKAVDATFCRAHGKSWEEVVGTSVADVWGADRFEEVIKGNLDQCFTGQALEEEAWFTFGERGHGCYQVIYTPYFNEDGTVAYAKVVSYDITERKLAEEALRESEEKFRAIFDHANDGILLMDAETRKFILGNQKICEMLGYGLEEIQNLGFRDILPRESPPHLMEQFEEKLNQEFFLPPEIPVQRKDGSIFYAAISTAPLMLKKKIFLVGILRDLTEGKRAEEEKAKLEAYLVKAQEMEAIGTLAGDVARDLNNILTAILGNIGLAIMDDKLGRRVQDRLAQAEEASLRAQALSQQLLTFAKVCQRWSAGKRTLLGG